VNLIFSLHIAEVKLHPHSLKGEFAKGKYFP
jgi:hypothetical protein